MTPDRKPTAAFWLTVALVAVLVAYPLSVGPACWWSSRFGGEKSVSELYCPLVNTCAKTTITKGIVSWYSSVGAAKNWRWIKDSDNASLPLRWRWTLLNFF